MCIYILELFINEKTDVSPLLGVKRFKMSVNSITNQKEITPKIKAELWFSCMTHRLIVLYNCMKVHSNSCNGHEIELYMIKVK